jgi:hypothetical protein
MSDECRELYKFLMAHVDAKKILQYLLFSIANTGYYIRNHIFYNSPNLIEVRLTRREKEIIFSQDAAHN